MINRVYMQRSLLCLIVFSLLFGVLLTFTKEANAAVNWEKNKVYVGGDRVTHKGILWEAKWWNRREPGTTGKWGPWKRVTEVPADKEAPTVPMNLKGGEVTSSQVSFTWTASTDNVGVVGYKVYDVKGLLVKEVKSTQVVIDKLKASTTYRFTVTAVDAVGNESAHSSVLSISTLEETVATTPKDLKANAISTSEITISWSPVANAVAYDLEVDGKAVSNVSCSYQHRGLVTNSTHKYRVRAKNAVGVSGWSKLVSATTLKQGPKPKPLGRVVVGYWHNFDNRSTVIRLRDVKPEFNVINVSFAEPVGDRSTMAFAPFNATDAEFKSDIKYLNSQGKKVLISIGGANGTVHLDSKKDKDNFVRTMIQIIEKYGFNGMDIDLEGSSLALTGGDTDFRNPTTPKIVNLITATKEILAHFGPDFILSMAPETAYVQGGYGAYGGPWGAYLPVIHALRDQMNYIHVQHYNSGSMTALDGQAYAQSTADFHVAMAEMLLQGFPVGRDQNKFFPPLRPEQVAIGIPACPKAAGGGYTNPAEMKKALDYLIKGIPFGGRYKLQNSKGYPQFRGIMTWSINWDAASNYEFSTTYSSYFNGMK